MLESAHLVEIVLGARVQHIECARLEHAGWRERVAFAPLEVGQVEVERHGQLAGERVVASRVLEELEQSGRRVVHVHDTRATKLLALLLDEQLCLGVDVADGGNSSAESVAPQRLEVLVVQPEVLLEQFLHIRIVFDEVVLLGAAHAPHEDVLRIERVVQQTLAVVWRAQLDVLLQAAALGRVREELEVDAAHRHQQPHDLIAHPVADILLLLLLLLLCR